VNGARGNGPLQSKPKRLESGDIKRESLTDAGGPGKHGPHTLVLESRKMQPTRQFGSRKAKGVGSERDTKSSCTELGRQAKALGGGWERRRQLDRKRVGGKRGERERKRGSGLACPEAAPRFHTLELL